MLRAILPLLSCRGSWKKRDKAWKEEKMSLGLRVKGILEDKTPETGDFHRRKVFSLMIPQLDVA